MAVSGSGWSRPQVLEETITICNHLRILFFWVFLFKIDLFLIVNILKTGLKQTISLAEVYFGAIIDSMDMKKRTKINELITNWIPGAVYSVKWLKENGYTYSNLQIYKKSGWVKAIGAGALVKSGDEVEWTGAVWALQEQLKLPLHVGGKTAIEQAGSAQYLTLDKERVFLIADPKTKLPTWFKNKKWDAEIVFLQSSLFDESLKALSIAEQGLTSVEFGRLKIVYSSRERAMLEYLDQVPERHSFTEAHEIMENLLTLRPKLVQTLLVHCKSVKAKRLFLAMADRVNHPWFKKIDLSKIDLGSGSRQLVSGGEFDSKYKITIGNSKGSYYE